MKTMNRFFIVGAVIFIVVGLAFVAFVFILRYKMQMPTVGVDPLHIIRIIDTYQRPLQVFEIKIPLRLA